MIKILLVEDVKLDAELTERELKIEGIDFISKRVEEVSDFRSEIENFKPDIILSDHCLPHFNGISALKIATNLSPETPFIFVSGKIDEEFAVEMFKKGAMDYVLKNNPSTIGYSVRKALNEHNKQIEHKMVENSLMESEKKYRTLFENNNNPIILFDEDGNFEDSNEAGLKFLDLKREKLLKKNLSDYILCDINNENMEFWKNDDITEVEFNVNGEHKILELTVTPVYLTNKTLVFGVGKDITERKKAEDKILRSLKEKELLLREIHHRVKNNLQIISTLLSLQSSKSGKTNVEDLYIESQNRIQSIALIHENLYKSDDLAHINFEAYVKDLISDLFDSYGVNSSRIKLNLNIEEFTMGIETAIPCGLIINELISNSLKHGFSSSETGQINLQLHKDGEYSLIVSDTGSPFPEEMDITSNDTLGLELIKNLVTQLDAKLTFKRDIKEFTIIFKELE
jgi:PAS domain S-box-containing protein